MFFYSYIHIPHRIILTFLTTNGGLSFKVSKLNSSRRFLRDAESGRALDIEETVGLS